MDCCNPNSLVENSKLKQGVKGLKYHSISLNFNGIKDIPKVHTKGCLLIMPLVYVSERERKKQRERASLELTLYSVIIPQSEHQSKGKIISNCINMY